MTAAAAPPGPPAAPLLSPEGWCQRWRHRRPAWQHRHGRAFDPDRYTVEPIGASPARRFVIDHHYASSWLAARMCFGLIDRTPHLDDYPEPHLSALTPRGRIVGVAVLSTPQHKAVLLNPFPQLVPSYESIDLGRFTMLDPVPANGESWFLARAFRLARRRGIRAVVGFADPVPRRHGDIVIMPGHVGWAYQGANGVYLGRSDGSRQIMLPDGTALPGRAISKVRRGEPGGNGVAARLLRCGAPPPSAGEAPAAWLARALNAIGAVTTTHPGKHKYAWPLSRGRTARLAQAAQDYPKAPDLTGLIGGAGAMTVPLRGEPARVQPAPSR